MTSTPNPLIGQIPFFNPRTSNPNDLAAAASPVYQQLLAMTGGNLTNVNSIASTSPQAGQQISLMQPGGGLNPQQASQFGPLFGLLMSLMGGGQMPGTQGTGL